jgi:hypothetical protein
MIDRYGLLLQCGFEEGARLNGEHTDISLEDVMLIMQDNPDAVQKMLRVIAEDHVEKNPPGPRVRQPKR